MAANIRSHTGGGKKITGGVEKRRPGWNFNLYHIGIITFLLRMRYTLSGLQSDTPPKKQTRWEHSPFVTITIDVSMHVKYQDKQGMLPTRL